MILHRRYGLTAVATGIFALSALTGCASAAPSADNTSSGDKAAFDTVTDGCLTVAFVEGGMPRVSSADDGLDGYEGHLLTQVAEANGLDICPFPTDFAGAVVAVSSGQADVATTLYYTEERSKQVYYSDTVILDTLAFLYPSDIDYEAPDDLLGLKWGAVGSWTYTQALQDYYGAGSILLAPGTTEVLQLLENGQAEASLFGSVGPAVTVAKERPELEIALLKEGDLDLPESIRVSTVHNAVNCANSALAEEINALLAEMITSGAWKEELASWGISDMAVIPEPNATPKQGC